jgi:hypothetical protein
MLFDTQPDQFDPTQLRFVEIGEFQSELEFPLSSRFPVEHVTVEWSEDLINWSREGVSMAPIGQPGESLKMQVTIVSSSARPRLFVRIVIIP